MSIHRDEILKVVNHTRMLVFIDIILRWLLYHHLLYMSFRMADRGKQL